LNNFEILWDHLDRRYSYFTYKGINWDSIYQIYKPAVHENIHDTLLFKILGGMMLQLKDAHTDIWSHYGRIHYDHADGYPANFSRPILESIYLGSTAGFKEGIRYRVIDSVGYMHIQSFSNEITDAGFREIISELSGVKGYIIDVRDNEGGNSNNGLTMAKHFFDIKRLVEITHYKTGDGHDDFASIEEYIDPGNGLGINKQTVILTNRRSYSATNFFVCWMSILPHVTLVGDTTGGGGGTPHYRELPNGWRYRYSSNQSYRPDGLNLDLGIPPDHVIYQTKEDTRLNEDTLLKYALGLFD
jgi:C-terminal processing protease CtpA/Prc